MNDERPIIFLNIICTFSYNNTGEDVEQMKVQMEEHLGEFLFLKMGLLRETFCNAMPKVREWWRSINLFLDIIIHSTCNLYLNLDIYIPFYFDLLSNTV